MDEPRFRYTSPDEDSARWQAFAFRPGDIVISTRSKSGTTWAQMICLLLVFGTPELPGAATPGAKASSKPGLRLEDFRDEPGRGG